MKLHAPLLFLAAALACRAADLRSFEEGEAGQRARLEELYAAEPPALAVANWLNAPETSSLESWKGKVVVLKFWATFCGPCRRSFPRVNELAAKYEGRVVFVGICHPRKGEDMAAVAKAHGLRFPLCLDTDGATARAYRVSAYPDYYLIGRDGRLAVADCADDKLEQAIEAVLGE